MREDGARKSHRKDSSKRSYKQFGRNRPCQAQKRKLRGEALWRGGRTCGSAAPKQLPGGLGRAACASQRLSQNGGIPQNKRLPFGFLSSQPEKKLLTTRDTRWISPRTCALWGCCLCSSFHQRQPGRSLGTMSPNSCSEFSQV